jgi:pimeloyl-ACP methyl ester carboxylesterase
MDARITGSRRLAVVGAGHLVSLEQPALFNRMLRDFVDALP